jgi:hypothetical protein
LRYNKTIHVLLKMNRKTIAVTAVLAAAVLTGIFATSPLAVYAQWEDSENEEETFDTMPGTDNVADEETTGGAFLATDTGQDAADEAEDAAEDAEDEGNFLTFGSFDPTEVRTSSLVDVNEDAEDFEEDAEDFEEDAEDFEEEMDN